MRSDCPESSVISLLGKSRELILDMTNKLLKCLEKTFNSISKLVQEMVSDLSSCFRKPSDFIKCVSRTDLPKKMQDMVNALSDTAHCLMG